MLFSSKKISLLLYAMVPAAVVLLLMIVALVPKHVNGLGQFMPLLHMAAIFYWGLHHARHMPYWLVFIAGLLLDAASGQPMGFSSLLMLAFLMMVRHQYKIIHKEGFVLQWGMFGLALAGMGALQWLGIALYDRQFSSPLNGIIQWFLTWCCYPLLHHLFDALNHKVQNQRYQLLHGR